MSVQNIQATYQQGQQSHLPADDSDVEEEALANDYKEQVRYDDNDLDRVPSVGGSAQDLQAQLVAAAQPLEYQATLETKIASYDSYCNLFHYILNSDGPVDLEVPSVCAIRTQRGLGRPRSSGLTHQTVLLGMGGD